MDGKQSRREPKILYRRLDAIFGSLESSQTSNQLVESFLDDLFRTMQDQLRIVAASLYRETSDGFELVKQVGPPQPEAAQLLPFSLPTLVLLFRNRTYLYRDAGVAPTAAGIFSPGPAAAILVGERPNRHAIFFLFQADWDPEEIDFALNTARAALGPRLLEARARGSFREAAEIQNSLLEEDAPEFPGFDIACRSIPADEVGGDFFDFINFGNESLGVAIGDASGHGLPAALLVRDVVTGLRMGIEKDLKIRYVFRKLNRVIHRSRLTSRFVSLFYAEIESNGNVIYVNAGHQPPMLFLRDRVHELRTGGTVIGPLPEVRFKRGFAHVDRGATLLLYTDGIIERRNAAGDFFGEVGLRDLVLANPQASAQSLVESIFKTVIAYGEGSPWQDDATVVVVKRDSPR